MDPSNAAVGRLTHSGRVLAYRVPMAQTSAAKRTAKRKALIARLRAEQDEALLLRGICPSCEHQTHTTSCAKPQSMGEHWVSCGCTYPG